MNQLIKQQQLYIQTQVALLLLTDAVTNYSSNK